ncbi:MAG: DUF3825 domain-containing protein [Bacillota bacterium]
MLLFKFAFCHEFDRKLEELSEIASREPWRCSDEEGLPILRDYVLYTFNRLADECKYEEGELGPETKISVVDTNACFNTGLFTQHFERVFGLFCKSTREGTQPWFFQGFVKESDPRLRQFAQLPERASYFSSVSELVFDYRLEIGINKDHILSDDRNLSRLPAELKNPVAFEGSVNIAKKKVPANYRLAIPQYHEGRIQLLIPLGYRSERADVALVISKASHFCTGHTCLSLKIAYNNATLIAKPDADWLSPR